MEAQHHFGVVSARLSSHGIGKNPGRGPLLES